jgi:hypothetical protein
MFMVLAGGEGRTDVRHSFHLDGSALILRNCPFWPVGRHASGAGGLFWILRSSSFSWFVLPLWTIGVLGKHSFLPCSDVSGLNNKQLIKSKKNYF